MNFFLSLLLCTNFFSWHFPLHEFFFGFFPIPPITFLMVRPLISVVHKLVLEIWSYLVNMAKFSWPVGGRINCSSNRYATLLLLSKNAFDWQVYVSLLRMYLEPPNVSGKEVHRNITVALNVLQEHRQKIATAKVLFHYVTLQHFVGVYCSYALTWHFKLACVDLNSWYFTFRVDQNLHTFEKKIALNDIGQYRERDLWSSW